MKGYIVVSPDDTKANILFSLDKAIEIKKQSPDSRIITINISKENLSEATILNEVPERRTGCYYTVLKIMYAILLILIGAAILSCFGIIPLICMQIWTCISALIFGVTLHRTINVISHVQNEGL